MTREERQKKSREASQEKKRGTHGEERQERDSQLIVFVRVCASVPRPSARLLLAARPDEAHTDFYACTSWRDTSREREAGERRRVDGGECRDSDGILMSTNLRLILVFSSAVAAAAVASLYRATCVTQHVPFPL